MVKYPEKLDMRTLKSAIFCGDRCHLLGVKVLAILSSLAAVSRTVAQKKPASKGPNPENLAVAVADFSSQGQIFLDSRPSFEIGDVVDFSCIVYCLRDHIPIMSPPHGVAAQENRENMTYLPNLRPSNRSTSPVISPCPATRCWTSTDQKPPSPPELACSSPCPPGYLPSPT